MVLNRLLTSLIITTITNVVLNKDETLIILGGAFQEHFCKTVEWNPYL